jgi:hypothetical protein
MIFNVFILVFFILSCTNQTTSLQASPKPSFEVKKITELYAQKSILVQNKLWFVTENTINSYDLGKNKLSVYNLEHTYNMIRHYKNDIWFFNSVLWGTDYEQLNTPLIRYNIIKNKFYYTQKNF